MAIAIDQAVVGTRMPCADNSTLVLTTTNAVASGGFIVLVCYWFIAGQTLTSVTGAGSVLVAGTADFTGITGTSTPTSPSLETWDALDCGAAVRAGAYRIETSAGSYAVAGTYTGNCQSASVGAAYLAAPPTQTQIPVLHHAIAQGAVG